MRKSILGLVLVLAACGDPIEGSWTDRTSMDLKLGTKCAGKLCQGSVSWKHGASSPSCAYTVTTEALGQDSYQLTILPGQNCSYMASAVSTACTMEADSMAMTCGVANCGDVYGACAWRLFRVK